MCMHSLVCNLTDYVKKNQHPMHMFLFIVMFIGMKQFCIVALKPLYSFFVLGLYNRWNSHKTF